MSNFENERNEEDSDSDLFDDAFECIDCEKKVEDALFDKNGKCFCSQQCLENYNGVEEQEEWEDNLTNEKIWQTFEETGELDGWDGEKVDIRQDYKKYEGKNLIIKNCSNLKKIKADYSGFVSLTIDNCQNLEKLSAYNTEIKDLSLNNCPNLKTVYVPYGKIEEFSVDKCPNIEHLNVSTNKLTKLDFLKKLDKIKILNFSYNPIVESEVSHLEFLEKLICNKCNLIRLNASNLIYLKELDCAGNGFIILNEEGKAITTFFTELNIDNCPSLEILDCGENGIAGKYLLRNHSKLKEVSFKNNRIEVLVIEECPELKYLNFAFQGEKEYLKFGNSGEYLANFYKVFTTNLYIDKESRKNLWKILYSKAKVFELDSEEDKQLTLDDFPSLDKVNSGVSLLTDDPSFEEAIDQRKAQEEAEEQRKLREANPIVEDEGYHSGSEQKKKKQNDEIPLCSWRLPTDKENTKKIDLPHKGLIGKLIIEDYPNLTFINVGNNDLEALVVRNCPKLKRLIYAHNNLREPEADISNCEKLTSINNYKCQGGWERPNLTDDERKKWEEQLNNEWEKENKNSESYKGKKEQFIKDLLILVEDIENDANKGDWKSVKEKITKLKEWIFPYDDWITEEIKERINKLEQRLLEQTSISNKTVLPLVVGLMIILPLTLVIIVLLAKRWIVADLHQQVNQIAKKKKKQS
ncbi:MAG: hypothetical protein LBR43_03470 [Spiroplasmataceae bacterium]|nr:hypothetical protein [Spiroplasmataceae bacterium]